VQWRILARLARVPLYKILQRNLNTEEKNQIRSHAAIAGALPIWLDDSSALSPEQIRRKAIEQRNRDGLDLIIIDQLRHVKGEGQGPVEQRMNAFVGCCYVAKDLKLPVLLLHQANRQTMQNKNNTPTLAELKQTGEIEESARAVWFVHRPAYYDDSKDKNEMVIIVAKQTNGPTGSTKLFCDVPTMFVSDIKDNRTESRNDF
jgi:replicative DNA helicase